MGVFVCNRLFFQSSFRPTAKMSRKYRDFPYTLCPHTASPFINILHQRRAFVTINDLTLTHHYHPDSVVYIRVYPGIVHSVGLDKCIIIFVHHYSITQGILMPLKVSFPLPIYSSPMPPSSWQPMILLLSPQCCFFRNVTELESCSMQAFQIVFFHLVTCIYLSFMSFQGLKAHSFLC